MYIIKSEPDISINGKLNEEIQIVSNILFIGNNNLKYEQGKWFSYGYDNKWYYLGLGACPCYELEERINNPLFDNIFEYPNDVEE